MLFSNFQRRKTINFSGGTFGIVIQMLDCWRYKGVNEINVSSKSPNAILKLNNYNGTKKFGRQTNEIGV